MCYTIKSCRCPKCNKELNRATNATGNSSPQGGDLSICGYCTSFLVFREDTSVELLDRDEFLKLPKETRERMIDARDLLNQLSLFKQVKTSHFN
ncbi:MAG: hypothetical protein KIS94_05695 [Chitinophagales bacterium]|nr:hypothetical protein [Chitinophagales bacterium]